MLRHDADERDALQHRLDEYSAAQEPLRLAREAFASANKAEAVGYTRELRLKQIHETAQARDDRVKMVSGRLIQNIGNRSGLAEQALLGLQICEFGIS